MIKDYHITTHQVSQRSADEIKKGFIARKNLLNRILTKINNTNRTDSIQHSVFVGPRGSGKSSILNRIKVEYLESDKFIPIYLPEEQPGLYRLFDVWLAIIDELKALGYHIQRPEIDMSQEDFSYLSKTGYTVISQFLQTENKQIILLMDNIDRVFKNIDDDKALLRELLQNHKDLIIIGGSTEMSEDFWDYGDPFYQFFKIIQLDDLSKAEVNDLLTHWSEVHDLPEIKDVLRTNPGKVEAIRQMTGGNPRTMIMFIRLLVDNAHAQGFEYLKDIMDQTTAIYQERLQQLTPQQRKIIVELASIWQPATVEQLVQTCLMPSSLISAQLNKLQKSRIVEALKPKKGKTVYRLKERMFNLYLIMTQAGALQKKRARYLTDFLEVWYDEREIQNYYYSTIQHFDDFSNSHGLVRAKALAHSKYLTIEQRDHLLDLVQESPGFYGSDISMLPEKAVDLMDKAYKEYQKQKFNDAIKTLLTIEQTSESLYRFLAQCYYEIGNFEEAEIFSKKAIDEGNTNGFNLYASILSDLNRKDEAEKYYIMAIDKGDNEALNNYAILLKELDRKEEAETYYLLAIQQGIINSLFNYANLLSETDRRNEAEIYYIKAIENDQVDSFQMLLLNYYFDDNKKSATNLILKYNRENYPELFKNIIDLWLQNLEEYQKNRNSLTLVEINDKPEFYIRESLVHYQYDWIIQLFNKYESLKQQFEVMYFAALMLQDPKIDVNILVPKSMLEAMQDVLRYVKERQAFYYGGKQNN